ncbi:aromatic ring-hydroxylating oxygenase subunit alpha [Rhodoplanes sp. Z2-YC6860]|uniref:aromatic ring-hydroxylating oxygenase subunit alpha n=1 Tax=Rhodoplanes sp. Z2-YC6860 TaxID=674703 RepID=UPI00078D01F6|nr:SRPBCC family protein [Rhodoplanes sp. Z2-YC6860]AMN41257.1 angular dioxygenase large subunit [Rhodoplanes sp. Z2-YC6860]
MSTLAEAAGRTGVSVPPAAFSEDLYKQELERVFGRSWLFVGHESLIPRNGDYLASYMGEDPVIVQRDRTGRVRVYLNRCRHRGNLLCVHDRGHAPSFVCSYHAWTYTDGALTGVPRLREEYRGEIDRSKLGLVEARAQVYGGLVFANWDAGAPSLDDYLGDARWWLEHFLLREELGGLEVLPGQQRYIVPVNWKLPAENFGGDYYHFAATHGSVVGALAKSSDKRIAATGATTAKADQPRYYCVSANYDRGAAHGFYEVSVGDAPRRQELALAEQIGPEAVAWFHERERLLNEKLQAFRQRPYSFHVANIFPNFSLIGVGSAFYGKGLIVHHPRGANRTEAWVWCAIEKNAPPPVKKQQRFVLMQRQAAAGMVAPDDHENFERISETIDSGIARRVPFHYEMAMGYDREDPRPTKWIGEVDWPGQVTPQISEVNQRDFYRHWKRLMETA